MSETTRRNRASWNARVPIHLASDFYDVEGFVEGRCTLQAEPDLRLLGDVQGRELLHLQCHFGQDTLSLARRGARATGLDFSQAAIDAASELAGRLALDARFVCANVYDAAHLLGPRFDTVYTSYGVLGWLEDVQAWAHSVAGCLRPGGDLVLVEFHPVVWLFDPDFQRIAYPYSGGPFHEQDEGTYAQPDAPLSLPTIEYGWGLADVIGALLKAGLVLEQLEELDFSPHDCFRHTIQVAPGRFQIAHLAGKIPMIYALRARKPA